MLHSVAAVWGSLTAEHTTHAKASAFECVMSESVFSHAQLQCVAECCSVLQYVAECCSALQHTTHAKASAFEWVISESIFSHTKLQCVAECGSVLQYVAVCCSEIYCGGTEFPQMYLPLNV